MLLGVVVLLFWNHEVRARSNQSEATQAEPHGVGSQMVDYVKQGRYDDAVQIGLKALQNGPHDAYIYQEIADVYLIRANKSDPGQRDQWVAKAVSYVEKALSAYSPSQDAAGVELLQIARSLEKAGDLSTSDRCPQYEKAQKLLEQRVPVLQGESITLKGKTFPLDPLRKENERTLAEVKERATKAGCGH
jgi:tetratricopeptide (TPR) repeat protein